MKMVRRIQLECQGFSVTANQALASLESQPNFTFEVKTLPVGEPTEEMWVDAIEWTRGHDFSHFLALVALDTHC
jgi:hypothetical protein